MSAYYNVNFTTANNVDLRQAFAIKDGADVPIDLTSASLKMGFENRSNNDVLEASNANGRITVIDAPAGQFEIAVPASDMTALSPGVYNHDLVLTLANDNVHRLWKGTLTLQRGVTE